MNVASTCASRCIAASLLLVQEFVIACFPVLMYLGMGFVFVGCLVILQLSGTFALTVLFMHSGMTASVMPPSCLSKNFLLLASLY